MLPKIYRSPRVRLALSAIALALFTLALASSEGNPAQAIQGAQSQQTPTLQPTTRPILLTDPVPDPKQAGVQYFPQTGHTLRGAFLDYWNRYGGLAQFGYPLTEEFFEPVGADNKMYQVQYFERNRFELHPENKGTQFEVLLGVLGRDFRQQDPPATPLPAPAVYFQETAHNLSGAFKQYWDTHRGLFVHGYPITEPQMERSTNGKEYLVQWFERSRFELHPENSGSPYEVLLGLLGRQLSGKKGYPYGWYPLYGRALDFSWVAGKYDFDLRFCSPCGCDTVRYVQNEPRLSIRRGVSVQPDGPIWKSARELRGPEAAYLSSPIIIFGRLRDPARLEPEPSETCEKPLYIVEAIMKNPVR